MNRDDLVMVVKTIGEKDYTIRMPKAQADQLVGSDPRYRMEKTYAKSAGKGAATK